MKKINKDNFIYELRKTFEELLLNQVDLINSDEVEEQDERMLVALFQLFDLVLKNDEIIDMLYKSNIEYNEVKNYIENNYKKYN